MAADDAPVPATEKAKPSIIKSPTAPNWFFTKRHVRHTVPTMSTDSIDKEKVPSRNRQGTFVFTQWLTLMSLSSFLCFCSVLTLAIGEVSNRSRHEESGKSADNHTEYHSECERAD